MHISLGAVDVHCIFGTEKKLLFILHFMNYSFSKKFAVGSSRTISHCKQEPSASCAVICSFYTIIWGGTLADYKL